MNYSRITCLIWPGVLKSRIGCRNLHTVPYTNHDIMLTWRGDKHRNILRDKVIWYLPYWWPIQVVGDYLYIHQPWHYVEGVTSIPAYLEISYMISTILVTYCRQLPPWCCPVFYIHQPWHYVEGVASITTYLEISYMISTILVTYCRRRPLWCCPVFYIHQPWHYVEGVTSIPAYLEISYMISTILVTNCRQRPLWCCPVFYIKEWQHDIKLYLVVQSHVTFPLICRRYNYKTFFHNLLMYKLSCPKQPHFI